MNVAPVQNLRNAARIAQDPGRNELDDYLGSDNFANQGTDEDVLFFTLFLILYTSTSVYC